MAISRRIWITTLGATCRWYCPLHRATVSRALTLDGKQPTLKYASSGAYPYHKRLFLVTAAKPPPAVARFIAFVRSPAGRKIFTDNGNWVP